MPMSSIKLPAVAVTAGAEILRATEAEHHFTVLMKLVLGMATKVIVVVQ